MSDTEILLPKTSTGLNIHDVFIHTIWLSLSSNWFQPICRSKWCKRMVRSWPPLFFKRQTQKRKGLDKCDTCDSLYVTCPSLYPSSLIPSCHWILIYSVSGGSSLFETHNYFFSRNFETLSVRGDIHWKSRKTQRWKHVMYHVVRVWRTESEKSNSVTNLVTNRRLIHQEKMELINQKLISSKYGQEDQYTVNRFFISK